MAKKKKETHCKTCKAEYKTYSVPVKYEVNGTMTVRATNPAEAIQTARDKFNGPKSIECPDFWIDFANDDEESEVNEDEE